jgi:hypothetical protein
MSPVCGGRGGDELDDGADVGEGPTPPIHRDEAEQAVLDLVPLGPTGRIVGQGDLQAGIGRQLRQVPFQARAR